jgi:hypothetical protein
VALFATVSCRSTKREDIAGTWHVKEDSRSILPSKLKSAPATIVFNADGTFVASDMPDFLSSALENSESQELDAGSGVWSLTSEDGRQAVQLVFHTRQGQPASQVPYGTYLEISNGIRPTVYYFIGDPDEGKMVEFERAK